MSAETEINQLFTQMDSSFFKSLAEPVRLEIIKLLLIKGESDVGALAKGLPQDRSVISRHLAKMEDAGIVSARKQGRHMFYQLRADQFIGRFEDIVASAKKCVALGCC
jgi:DNA-binding transcriptional ArsR family regulator